MPREYNEYPCDLCGHNQAVEVPNCREYTNGQAIHICVNCGFVYVKYRRSAEDIASSWSDEIFGDGYTARIPAVKARQVYVAETIDTEVGLRGKYFGDIRPANTLLAVSALIGSEYLVEMEAEAIIGAGD